MKLVFKHGTITALIDDISLKLHPLRKDVIPMEDMQKLNFL